MTDRHQSEAEESVRLACRSLRSAVAKLVASKAKRNLAVRQDEARLAAEHACHALTTLGDKRRSLRGAIRALDELGDAAVSVLEESATSSSSASAKDGERDDDYDDAKRHAGKTARVVLCHWMRQYLRVRDGVVLMQTGECRHPADVTEAGGGRGGNEDRGRGGADPATAGQPARKRLKKKGGGGDKVATANSFRSRFGGDRTLRGDGYTRMYSASCYSGYSLDELLDQEVGVRARLSAALAGEREADMDMVGMAAGERRRVQERREREWSRLMDKAVLFDNELNRHEDEFKELVKELDQNRKRFVESVNSLLARLHSSVGKVETSSGIGSCGGGNFALAGGDKLEKLELTNAGALRIRLLRIQRRGGGDDGGGGFRVSDPAGALPSDASVRDWRRRMLLPTLPGGGGMVASSRAEEGGEEGVDGLDSDFMPPNENVIGGGLRVKTEFFAAAGKASPGKRAEVSLKEIKNRMGVDGESLRASREGLEAETEEVERRGGRSEVLTLSAGETSSSRSRPSAHPSSDVCDDDVTVVAELDDDLEEISRTRDQLARCKKALRDVRGDEEQEWDARESLRETLMTLGSHLLELYTGAAAASACKDTFGAVWRKIASFPGNPSGPMELLREAERLFKSAVKVVQMLQASHDGNANDSHDDVITNNLLLLRGRAFVNLGISVIEQAQCGIRRTQSGRPFMEGQNGVSLLGKAVEALKSAEEAARKMRAKSEVAWERATQVSEGLSEALTDVFQAAQLESLACRWHGTALWHMGERKGAEAILDASAGKGEKDCPDAGQDMDGVVMEAKFRCLLERYFGAMTLREVAVAASEACVQKGQMEKEGDALVSLACRAYHRAGIISREIYRHTDNLRNSSIDANLVSEHQVYPEEKLLSAVHDLKQWWQERKGMRQDFNLKSQKSGTSLRSIPTNLPRNDVRASASLDAPRGPPSVTITMKHGPRKRKKTSRRTTEREVNADEVFDSSAYHDLSMPHPQCGHQQMQFRKWGDELLPQTQKDDGGTTVLLQYPSCAPPMPPELVTGRREDA